MLEPSKHRPRVSIEAQNYPLSIFAHFSAYKKIYTDTKKGIIALIIARFPKYKRTTLIKGKQSGEMVEKVKKFATFISERYLTY